ncbi:hypothetical protein [Leptospira meyeri]|uniref:hypothetical protein n=1 Tax=Leptospira meyeri TaxID=29508 RepID=UPI000C2B016E|nr:hypothetical protein [Leptospira meyeri]PJZ79269.1 hypothetical protein CH359_19035 [Leptospira meyeri]PJZ95103.1 hypothetical protein CH358_18995 [Leptospira meyeri]
MATIIESQNCLSAWKEVCQHILENGNGFNLLVCITNPLDINDQQLKEVFTSDLISKRIVEDVTNTIFPYKFYLRNRDLEPSDFYDLHEKIYLRGKTMHKKNKSRWGNYFLRFTKFGEEKKNQLQKIIDDLNNRDKNYSACYYMHVSSADTDSNTKNIGNPCLQYVQFAQEENSINLTAIYRNHDFYSKALGNYIGLSRLLEYICIKTQKNVGTITCHSIHYYLMQNTKVRNCIDGLSW